MVAVLSQTSPSFLPLPPSCYCCPHLSRPAFISPMDVFQTYLSIVHYNWHPVFFIAVFTFGIISEVNTIDRGRHSFILNRGFQLSNGNCFDIWKVYVLTRCLSFQSSSAVLQNHPSFPSLLCSSPALQHLQPGHSYPSVPQPAQHASASAGFSAAALQHAALQHAAPTAGYTDPAAACHSTPYVPPPQTQAAQSYPAQSQQQAAGYSAAAFQQLQAGASYTAPPVQPTASQQSFVSPALQQTQPAASYPPPSLQQPTATPLQQSVPAAGIAAAQPQHPSAQSFATPVGSVQQTKSYASVVSMMVPTPQPFPAQASKAVPSLMEGKTRVFPHVSVSRALWWPK